MKTFRIMGITILSILGTVLLSVLIFVTWIAVQSPGKTAPITDEKGNVVEGSIAEIQHLELNGIEQFVLIRGKTLDNPVLLMVHGGPGSAQAHMNCKFNQFLEDHYIVVNWDQRGAGASYFDSINSNNLNIDIMIEDTRELSEYLVKRFNKDKIFILGHSWGSYLSMRTVHKYPQLYHAYIGIGQVSDQRKSEQISYNFVLDAAKKENNKKAIDQLEKIGFPENGIYSDNKSIAVERNWVMHYGGSAWNRDRSDFFSMFVFPLLSFKEYRFSDKINYLRGSIASLEVLWMPLMDQQLPEIVQAVEVPVYMLHGIHDYQTSFVLAKLYFDSLQAPEKTFIEFENSAHMLPYNFEIEKFKKILIEQTINEVLN